MHHLVNQSLSISCIYLPLCLCSYYSCVSNPLGSFQDSLQHSLQMQFFQNNSCLFIPISRDRHKQFIFIWKCNFMHLCHNLSTGDLNQSPVPRTTLGHYTDNVMLVRWNEQKVAGVQDAQEKHTCVRGWEIPSGEIQGPAISVKFLGIRSGEIASPA